VSNAKEAKQMAMVEAATVDTNSTGFETEDVRHSVRSAEKI
jgi:hypothetical protein